MNEEQTNTLNRLRAEIEILDARIDATNTMLLPLQKLVNDAVSESLLAACKAAGIEDPKYIAQDKDGWIYHFSEKPYVSSVSWLWEDDSQYEMINHPPYADDWQESLLEFRDYALISTCDKCQAVTAIDMVGSDANEKELQCDGKTVFRVSKEEALGAVIKLCKCACGVENFNITKAAAMAKWRESFGFTETEKQQIEDYAVAENEPLADVLARHPEHIADTSKMIPSGIESLVCADIVRLIPEFEAMQAEISETIKVLADIVRDFESFKRIARREAMTTEQINIAIAESMGFSDFEIYKNLKVVWAQKNGIAEIIPNYTSDLNACHEFEKSFNNCEVKWGEYRHNLMFTLERERHELHATARQRCEAYLRTLGKWKEGA